MKGTARSLLGNWDSLCCWRIRLWSTCSLLVSWLSLTWPTCSSQPASSGDCLKRTARCIWRTAATVPPVMQMPFKTCRGGYPSLRLTFRLHTCRMIVSNYTWWIPRVSSKRWNSCQGGFGPWSTTTNLKIHAVQVILKQVNFSCFKWSFLQLRMQMPQTSRS